LSAQDGNTLNNGQRTIWDANPVFPPQAWRAIFSSIGADSVPATRKFSLMAVHMCDVKIGDHVPSALDTAYHRYADWFEARGIKPAPYAIWLRCEGGHNANNMTLQTAAQRRRFQADHAQEIEARRTAALRNLGIAIR
jgi:hypothetical protein